jgi:hypothetical protein
VTAFTDDPGLFWATIVLAGATIGLMFFTYVLGKHSKELNRFEKVTDNRRRLEGLLECTDAVMQMESHDVARRIDERDIEGSHINLLDRLIANSEFLSSTNRDSIIGLAKRIMGYFDGVRTRSYVIPDQLTILKEFNELKTLLAKERESLREQFAELD